MTAVRRSGRARKTVESMYDDARRSHDAQSSAQEKKDDPKEEEER